MADNIETWIVPDRRIIRQSNTPAYSINNLKNKVILNTAYLRKVNGSKWLQSTSMMSLCKEHGNKVIVEATRYGKVSMSSCSKNGTKQAKV